MGDSEAALFTLAGELGTALLITNEVGEGAWTEFTGLTGRNKPKNQYLQINLKAMKILQKNKRSIYVDYLVIL